MNNQKLLKLKMAFKKLYCITLEKYHMIVEKKAREQNNKQIEDVEQNIDKNLSKW